MAISWNLPYLSNDTFEAHFQHKTTKEIIEVKCNYGLPTDLLWVRETFGKKWLRDSAGGTRTIWIFKADGTELQPGMNWKPSIHMPKATARIWQRIIKIKVERLQNITEEDALKEGLLSKLMHDCIWFDDYLQPNTFPHIDPRDSFRSLWISINGLESWNANPWVWAIEFEVLSTTGKPATI